MEVVELCCNLLNAVMKYTSETTQDVSGSICLLLRVAFRHKMPGIQARANLLLPETLDKLTALIRPGDAEFIGDLTSAFTSISWHENQQYHIVWTAFKIPATLLSPTLQSVLVLLFGTAQWPLVERLDRKQLAHLIGRLPVDMIVQHIIDDGLVCVRWMRLLLFTTFRPPRETNTQPLWTILLSTLPKIPHVFSRDVLGHFDPSKFSLPDSNDPKIRMKEELPWMMLFWSSRFFEMDSKQWVDFKDATVGFGQRLPGVLKRLEKLCFGLEEEVLAGPDVATARTKAFTEMVKVGQRIDSIKRSKNLTSQAAPASVAERTADTEETDPLRPQRAAPKADRPSNNPPPPPADEDSFSQLTRPPRIVPQDTPQFNPLQDAMAKIQMDLRQGSPSVESLHPSPVRRTPSPSPPSLRESLALTDSDGLSYLSTHSRSREFLGVPLESHLLSGGTVPPLLPKAGNGGGADFPGSSVQTQRHEEHPPQVPKINPTKQNKNAASDPLAVLPRDTPPFSRTTRRQNTMLSQIQHNFSPSPIMSAGPPPSLPQQLPLPPSPSSQMRSESPVPINDDGGLDLSSTQSGSRVDSDPPDPGSQPMHPPMLPERGEVTESSSNCLPSLVTDGGD